MSESQENRPEELALGELLDDIDQLLDPDAEAFVRSYVQKGGQ